MEYATILDSDKQVKSVRRTIQLGDVEFNIADYSFRQSHTEDKLYADPMYRLLVPRGCCLTRVGDRLVHVLAGHPKFGYEGDYYDPEYPPLVFTRIYTRKENGQCAHISAFRFADQTYLVIGSKNVHLIVRETHFLEDVQHPIYQEGRYSAATNIANLLYSAYASKITRIARFCIENATTFCCEAIFREDQHIVDYAGAESLRFFAITYRRPAIESPLTWCGPLQAIDIFKGMELDTVCEYGIFDDAVSDRIRREENSEGAVVTWLDADGNAVYVYKHKNDTYTFLRAVREQMRHRAPNSAIQARIDGLHFVHERKAELTDWAMRFNRYYAGLCETERDGFFTHWVDHVKRFNELPPIEVDSGDSGDRLTVILMVGVQGSGKTTVACMIQQNLIAKSGFATNDVVHLEQDMFGGNPKLYHGEIKKTVQKPHVKFLILSKMNHTQFIRKGTRQIIEAANADRRPIHFQYVVFDLMPVDFYVDRVKSRGDTSSLTYTADTHSIVESTLAAYDPVEEVPRLSVRSDDSLQHIMTQVFDFIQQPIPSAFDEVAPLVRSSHGLCQRKKPTPHYDCIKINAADISHLIDDSILGPRVVRPSFHVTLRYYEGGAAIDEDFVEGQPTPIRVLGYAMDENCIAFVCSIDRPIEEGRIPHITYALTPGTSAVHSNNIVSDTSKIVQSSPSLGRAASLVQSSPSLGRAASLVQSSHASLVRFETPIQIMGKTLRVNK